MQEGRPRSPCQQPTQPCWLPSYPMHARTCVRVVTQTRTSCCFLLVARHGAPYWPAAPQDNEQYVAGPSCSGYIALESTWNASTVGCSLQLQLHEKAHCIISRTHDSPAEQARCCT
jgi:hypothetical protein